MPGILKKGTRIVWFMAVSGTCSLDPEGGRSIRKGIRRSRSRVGVGLVEGGLKSESESKWRKDLWTANSLSKHCQMVRSIGQKLSARTVDMKWVTTEVRRVSDIICKPNTWQMQRGHRSLAKSRHHLMFWSHLGWGDIFWAFYWSAWFEVLYKHFHKASRFALSYVIKSIKNMKKIH